MRVIAASTTNSFSNGIDGIGSAVLPGVVQFWWAWRATASHRPRRSLCRSRWCRFAASTHPSSDTTPPTPQPKDPRLFVLAGRGAMTEGRGCRLPETVELPHSSTSTARSIINWPERTKTMRSATSPCLHASAFPLRCTSLRQFAIAAMSCGVTTWLRSASSIRGQCLKKLTRCSMKCLWCRPANRS